MSEYNESAAGVINKDSNDLEQFGYTQELLRDMGGFSNFAISFSVISILTGAVTLYGYGFGMGGPAVTGIGWPLATIFTLLVAAGIAELASAIPTSGALYHWATILGGAGWGWFTAWFNMIGQFAITAGIDFGAAQFLAPLLGIEEDWNHFLVIYACILISHGLLNHVGIKVVAWLNNFSATYHIIGVVMLVGALLLFGPHHDVGYVFKTGFTTSEYPYWWAFLLGLLQAQWTFTGYDASAHTVEETVNPRVKAAWGVYLSVLVSAIFGFIMLFVLTTTIGDADQVAGASNPFIYVVEQALGGWAGRATLWMVTLAMWFCGLSSVTSNSRMIFAFSRDGGMPKSKTWATISKRFQSPVAAIWLSVVVAFLMAIYSGGYSVIVSISTIALYLSYGIPLFLKMRAQLNGTWTARNNGPWHLGKWSLPANIIGLIWIAFITVLFVAPPNDITGYTMSGITVLLVIYYMVSARKWFKGPSF